MSVRLVVESVNSATLLRRSLSKGDASEYGALENKTLTVEDSETAEQLVDRYPNVRYESDSAEIREPETVRMEADNTGVTEVSDSKPLAEKEYQELREMAMNADTDEINGRSAKDEIVAYFEG